MKISRKMKADKNHQIAALNSVSINIHTDDTVVHKAYGKGKVIEISDNRIIVSFSGLDNMFYYPDAFEQGYLKK